MPPHNSRPARLHVNQIINITHPPYTTRGYSREIPSQSIRIPLQSNEADLERPASIHLLSGTYFKPS